MAATESSGRLVKLEQECIDDSARWFPDALHLGLPYMVLALAGEVGELANLVKKIERGSLKWEDAKVQYDVHMETTDVFIYLLNIAGLLKIDLEAAYYVKRQFNESRFGSHNGTPAPSAGAQRLVRPRNTGAPREG